MNLALFPGLQKPTKEGSTQANPISGAGCSGFGARFKTPDLFGDFYCSKPKTEARSAVQNATSNWSDLGLSLGGGVYALFSAKHRT